MSNNDPTFKEVLTVVALHAILSNPSLVDREAVDASGDEIAARLGGMAAKAADAAAAAMES